MKDTRKEEKTETRDPRREAWDAYVEQYRISNPVKYAQKRSTTSTSIGLDGKEFTIAKRDELAEIPASFAAPKNLNK